MDEGGSLVDALPHKSAEKTQFIEFLERLISAGAGTVDVPGGVSWLVRPKHAAAYLGVPTEGNVGPAGLYWSAAHAQAKLSAFLADRKNGKSLQRTFHNLQLKGRLRRGLKEAIQALELLAEHAVENPAVAFPEDPTNCPSDPALLPFSALLRVHVHNQEAHSGPCLGPSLTPGSEAVARFAAAFGYIRYHSVVRMAVRVNPKLERSRRKRQRTSPALDRPRSKSVRGAQTPSPGQAGTPNSIADMLVDELTEAACQVDPAAVPFLSVETALSLEEQDAAIAAVAQATEASASRRNAGNRGSDPSGLFHSAAVLRKAAQQAKECFNVSRDSQRMHDTLKEALVQLLDRMTSIEQALPKKEDIDQLLHRMTSIEQAVTRMEARLA